MDTPVRRDVPMTFGDVYMALSEDYQSFWLYIMDTLLESDRARRGFDLAACKRVTLETPVTMGAIVYFLGELEYVIQQPQRKFADLFRIHKDDPYMKALLEIPTEQNPLLRPTPNLRGFLAALQRVTLDSQGRRYATA